MLHTVERPKSFAGARRIGVYHNAEYRLSSLNLYSRPLMRTSITPFMTEFSLNCTNGAYSPTNVVPLPVWNAVVVDPVQSGSGTQLPGAKPCPSGEVLLPLRIERADGHADDSPASPPPTTPKPIAFG